MPALRTVLAAASSAVLLAACVSGPYERERDRSRGEEYAYRGGVVTVTEQRGECELAITGEINQPALASLRLAADDVGTRRCRDRWVVLDIPDGQIGAAITAGSMLRNRHFNTRLPAGANCYTACMLVFAAGEARELSRGLPAPRMGFSRLPPDDDFGRGECDERLSNRQTQNLARYLRAMLPNRTADFMLDEIRATNCRDVRELRPRDAAAMGLVTER